MDQQTQNLAFEKLVNRLGQPIGIWPQFLFFCPRCNHRKPKLSINIETEEFNCWVCGSEKVNNPFMGHEFSQLFNGLNIPLIPGMENKSAKETTIDSLKSKLNNKQNVFKHKKIYNSEFEENFIPILKIKNKAIQNLCLNHLINTRGLSLEQVEKFNLGIWKKEKYQGRIIIPSYDENGNVDYFTARSYIPVIFEPSYINPTAEREKIIFNRWFIDVTKDVYLVEGFFDSVKLQNSIPILGSTISTKHSLFNFFIQEDINVIISLDPDALNKQTHIIELFRKFGITHSFMYNQTDKDIGKMTPIEVDTMLQSVSSSYYDVLRYKLFRK